MAEKERSHTGEALRALLASRGETQSSLAEALGQTRAYVSQVATKGPYQRAPSADWLSLVAGTLNLTPEEEVELHKAGALDHGFKLDLTTKT